MVKTEDSGTKEKPAAEKMPKAGVSKLKLFVWLVVILAVIGAAAYPQAVKKAYVYLEELHRRNAVQEPDPLETLRQEVGSLQRQLADMQYRLENQAPTTANVMIDDESLAEMKDRLNAIEKQNLNVIDSKADVALVLGLLTRMDKAEAQMGKLAKISDDGALILSATMMIKEAAAKGEPFAYEAEVLDLLARGDEKISQPVAEIVKYAPQGIKSKKTLTDGFNKIYTELLEQQKEEFAKTWKDRLISKLNEIIKVKRVKEEAPEFEEDKVLEKAKKLVDAGKIAKAVSLLDEAQHKDAAADAALSGWMSEARARIEFDRAVSRISTHSLALMKVNYLKGETNHD